MKNVFPGLGAGAALLVAAQAATQPVYINQGVMNDYPPPQIDATAFINYGTFYVSTALPYDFQSTLHFTNHGVMSGNPGFFFQTASSTQAPRPATSFVNDSGAQVSVSSHLIVNAANIQNRGLLSVGASGLLELQGQGVDVRHSRLEVRPTITGGFGDSDSVTETNFTPATGIYDNYWGGLTNATLNLPNFVTVQNDPFSVSVITPAHRVEDPFGWGTSRIGFQTTTVGAYTNALTETNQIIQAAFVGYDTNMLASRIRFSSLGSETGLQIISAEFTMPMTNSIDGTIRTETLYISDALGAYTNLVLLNSMDTKSTYRSRNYRVRLSPLQVFEDGDLGNAPLTSDLFSNQAYSNQTVDIFWSAYSPYVEGGALDATGVEGASVIDLPGRIEISGRTVDLRDARLRGNSSIRIESTGDVSDTSGTYIDAPNLVFNLTSASGDLLIRDITPDTITRFDGYVFLWSATWTNQSGTTTTNVEEDPANPGTMITNVATNTVDLQFHAFVVDGQQLGIVREVQTHGFSVHSTNVVVEDNVRAVGPLLLDAETVTLKGDLTFSGGDGHFAVTNAPRLRFLTNEGYFYIANTANFGQDRAKPYSTFVNRGTVDANAMRVRSDYFENSGRIQADGAFALEGKLGKFQHGRLSAGADVTLAVNDLKLNQFTNQTSGSLILSVTNSLADSGWAAGNMLVPADGLVMLRKPQYGDLLGTAVQSTAPRFAWIEHQWAAEDRGATVDGFTNNVALGSLLLSAGQSGFQQLRGLNTQGRYALYVDYLEFQGYVLDAYRNGNLESVFEVDPNVTIYFAYAPSSTPVEELDGALGGRFRWVRDFAGPRSSVDVLMPSGRTVRINKGLRESITIDSDGDGLANGYDPYPFAEPEVQAIVGTAPASKTTIQWMAAPQTTYVVEMTTDLAAGEWEVIATVANPEAFMRTLEAEDVLPEGVSSRYYRVRYNP